MLSLWQIVDVESVIQRHNVSNVLQLSFIASEHLKSGFTFLQHNHFFYGKTDIKNKQKVGQFVL